MISTALLLGFMGSFHCIGMCGPIAFMLPLKDIIGRKKIVFISLYHLGRLLAYSSIGFVFGWIGKGLYVFGLQQKLSILIGCIMLMAVLLPKTNTLITVITRPVYRILSNIKSGLGKAMHKKTADTFLTIGFLNGFLPCGLVYMGVFGAMAFGKASTGALYMFLFGLGTIPLMTSAIYLGQWLNTKTRQSIKKAIPIFIVIIGVLFIIRGLGLGIPFLSPTPVNEIINSEIDCH